MMRLSRTPEIEADIERMACSTDVNDRQMAAHLATPETLARLAGDEDVDVRLCVACNLEALAETRRMLEADPNPMVAEAARQVRLFKVCFEEPKDLTASPTGSSAEELARAAREYSLPLEPR